MVAGPGHTGVDRGGHVSLPDGAGPPPRGPDGAGGHDGAGRSIAMRWPAATMARMGAVAVSGFVAGSVVMLALQSPAVEPAPGRGGGPPEGGGGGAPTPPF